MVSNQTEFLYPPARVLTVSELTRQIKTLVEARIGAVWVEGEISNFRQQNSGHCYFTLKDGGAQLCAVLFRVDAALSHFRLADGLRVLAFGEVSVYEARGQYQIIVRELVPKGLGALQLAFEQLKRKLETEGLFDRSRKKSIPLLPQRIGIITSPSGAALRDILNILGRRFPNVHITIAPVRVQGDSAAQEIAMALDDLNAWKESGSLALDVVILARGGGSLEDLWVFNEEIVARAVARSKIPTISAVGHEIDFTICDFVADLRAPTPSAAAELVVQKKEQFVALLADYQSRLGKDLRLRLSELRERFYRLAQSYVFRQPADIVRQYQQRVDEIGNELNQRWQISVDHSRGKLHAAAEKLRMLSPREKLRDYQERFRHSRNQLALMTSHALTNYCRQVGNLSEQLELLSPRATLARGYTITRQIEGGMLIKSVKAIAKGQTIKTMVVDGEFTSEVK